MITIALCIFIWAVTAIFYRWKLNNAWIAMRDDEVRHQQVVENLRREIYLLKLAAAGKSL